MMTLPETNIFAENGWLEDEFPFGMAQFQGLCYFPGGYQLIFENVGSISNGYLSQDD